MTDFVIDADPLVPTGIPATVDQVVDLVVDGIIPPAAVAKLSPEQQPDDLVIAVDEVIAARVEAVEEVVAEDFADIVAEVAATQD